MTLADNVMPLQGWNKPPARRGSLFRAELDAEEGAEADRAAGSLAG